MITQTIVCDVCGNYVRTDVPPLRVYASASYLSGPAAVRGYADICSEGCAVNLLRQTLEQARKNYENP